MRGRDHQEASLAGEPREAPCVAEGSPHRRRLRQEPRYSGHRGGRWSLPNDGSACVRAAVTEDGEVVLEHIATHA